MFRTARYANWVVSKKWRVAIASALLVSLVSIGLKNAYQPQLPAVENLHDT